MAAPATPPGRVLPADPKRKRMVLALGAAAVLALIVLLQRRGAAAADPSGTPVTSSVPPGGSTFADNGQSLSAFSDVFTESVGNLQSVTDQLTQALTDNFTTTPGTTPPAGTPAAPPPQMTQFGKAIGSGQRGGSAFGPVPHTHGGGSGYTHGPAKKKISAPSGRTTYGPPAHRSPQRRRTR